MKRPKLFFIISIIVWLIACTYHASWHYEYYFNSTKNIKIAGYDIQVMLIAMEKEEINHHVIKKGPYRLNIYLQKEYRENTKINVSKLVINSIDIARSINGQFHITKPFPIDVLFKERYVGKHFNGKYPFYMHSAQFLEEKHIDLNFSGKEEVDIHIDLAIEFRDGSKPERLKKLFHFYPELREGEGRRPYLSV